MTVSDTLAALSEAVKATEYKYFGDYEFSDDQRKAVDTLVEAANAILSGQLVPVPSVETVARAIVRTNTEQRVRRDPRLTDEERSDIVECQVHNGWDLWVPEATAVIAAMQEGRCD